MTNDETALQVAVHEQQIKSLEKRMTKVEDLREQIASINVAIERQTGNIDRLTQLLGTLGERQGDQEARIDAIEKKPVEWLDKVFYAALGVIGTMIGQAVFAAFFVH